MCAPASGLEAASFTHLERKGGGASNLLRPLQPQPQLSQEEVKEGKVPRHTVLTEGNTEVPGTTSSDHFLPS